MHFYFLKRLLSLEGYLLKIVLLVSLLGYFLLTFWSTYEESITLFKGNYIHQYEMAKTLMNAYNQPISDEQTVREREKEERALGFFQETINFYESIIKEDYNAFPESYLKANNLQQERYLEGEDLIVPNRRFRTQAEFQHLNALEQTYYGRMVNSSINLDSKNVLKVSALDAILLSTGYWWAQGYKFDNLTYLFLIVPILFSNGILSKDKRRGNFFLAIRYSNHTYLKELFNTLFIHHTLLQTLLLLVFLLTLGIKFGILNSMATAQFNWGGNTILVSLVTWAIVYWGIIVFLTILLTQLSLIGELLFHQLGAVLIPILTSLASILMLNSYNPFAYLDLSRTINGYGNVLTGIYFSVDQFLIGWSILFVCLVCISKAILYFKATRCEYV